MAKHTSDTAVSKLDVMMIHWAIVRVLHQLPATTRIDVTCSGPLVVEKCTTPTAIRRVFPMGLYTVMLQPHLELTSTNLTDNLRLVSRSSCVSILRTEHPVHVAIVCLLFVDV